ncbi:hypothetical protein GUJ93_ZPchr0010g8224 [Zizania palustris]|uniref:Uncharacterized protein n=1 Tax=Zizania palustris TaxID=103762 RepID=A0A8J5WEE2_ZIZPA|nr:hypothetical protein GUJ93_ZPchr0010g8224 [Zizania palustris]
MGLRWDQLQCADQSDGRCLAGRRGGVLARLRRYVRRGFDGAAMCCGRVLVCFAREPARTTSGVACRRGRQPGQLTSGGAAGATMTNKWSLAIPWQPAPGGGVAR